MSRLYFVLAVCLCAGLTTLMAPTAAMASNLQVNIGPGEQAFGDCGLLNSSTSGSGISPADSCNGDIGLTLTSSRASHQAVGEYTLTAPPGITINQVSGSLAFSSSRDGKNAEYDAGDHWAGGGMHWAPGQTQTNTRDATKPPDTDISSPWWQFWLSCVASQSGGRGGDGCDSSGSLTIKGFVVQATESSAPSLIAAGSNNIFYQGAKWIWNPAGDPWSAAINGTDATGICQASVSVDQKSINDVASGRAEGNGWQQCPQLALPTSVDTQSFFTAKTGSFTLKLSDTNAGGISTSASTELNIDNVPPSVKLSTLNDSNPGGWAVNHSVTVQATPHTGPSGLSSLACTLDGAPATLNGNDEFTVDGNGQHTVACTAANGAIDPQGQPDTGSSSMLIDIDEQPPTLSFEPADPSDPARVVVDTSDTESAVAGGAVAIERDGSNSWTAIPTMFTSGGQLIATIPDAGLKGPYTVRATACSQVGNCGQTTEGVNLPLRVPAVSEVSFGSLAVPAVVVTRRVLVAFHYERVRRHHRVERVRVGGHVKLVRIVLRVNQACATKRVETRRRHWSEVHACRRLQLRLERRRKVPFGHGLTVRGVVLSREGVPVADARVVIATSPVDGLNQFVRVAVLRANSLGEWSLRLPAGPSRIIHAAYQGSPTTLPSVGSATVFVPARITLSATPVRLPWSGVVTFRGRLLGGYVPPDGVALRLLVRYPGAAKLTPLVALRTDRRGRFSIQWSYNAGQGVATYPFYIGTTAAESDYPFAPSQSRGVAVTFRP